MPSPPTEPDASPAPPPVGSARARRLPVPPPTSGPVLGPHAGSAREVLSFSAPLVLSTLSQSLMWVVDTFIMGRVGTVEQGAVGLGGVLVWAMFCLFGGTMTVVNILTAQEDGAGRKDAARHVRTGLCLAVPMSVAVLALRLVVPTGLGLLGATEEVRPLAALYVQIRLLAAPVWLCTFAITSFLRGFGDTRTPMLITLGANLVNAAVAIVLVFGLWGMPAMGVAGAAWGTVVAMVVEAAAYGAVYLFHPRAIALGSRIAAWPSGADLRQFLALGLPIGLGWLIEMVAWTAFSVYASTRPPAELAAHTVLFQVTSFCFMPAMALGVAASTLVGRYIGAKRPDLARRSATRTMALGAGYMVVMGLLIALFRGPLVAAFNPDPAVVALGSTIALIAGFYQPFDGLGIVAQGVLRGAGRTAVPTVVMLASGLGVFVPLVWLLGEGTGWGVRGAWLAALAHVVVVAAALGVVLMRSSWRKPVVAEA